MTIQTTAWTVAVQEDAATGEAVIEFPEELIQQVGWQEGDIIAWQDLGDGSWSLTKREDNMATNKTAVSKISNKLDLVNESFSINMYDNGFMLEISGKKDDDWRTAKILVSTVDELVELVREATNMDRDD